MRIVRIHVDPSEVENAIVDEIKDGKAQTDVDAFTDKVADTVRGLSPVGTGKFRRSIKTRKSPMAGQIYSDDDPDKVAAIEYGTSDTPEFAPFAKAALHHR